MLGHYLLVAFRNFQRRPMAAAVNILALSLGLTCFVLAYAVVGYWGHAEEGFAKADRTYTISREVRFKSSGIDTGWEAIASPFYARYLKLDFPEFETIAREANIGDVQLSAGARKLRMPAAYADNAFLDVFNLPFLSGTTAEALSRPDSVILTQEAAQSLFGTRDVVGRTVRFGQTDLTVTGVIGAIARPSHIGRSASATIRFDALISWDVLERSDPSFVAGTPENWISFCCHTYVVLPQGSQATPQSLAPRLAAFLETHMPKAQRDTADLSIKLLPIRDMMVARLDTMLFSGSDIDLSVTTLLMLFGGLVLLVACLNYANLATAQALRRAREVGLRKAIGASRRQIMTQYFLEAGLLTLAALVVALAAATAMAPLFRNAADIDLQRSLFSGLGFWVFIVGVIAAVTILAGAYPALFLSGVRPIEIMRPMPSGGRRLMPSLLVGAQFAAASFLLVTVIVMHQQTTDLRQTGLGSRSDPVVVIPNNQSVTQVNPDTLRNRLIGLPGVMAVSAASKAPWQAGVNLMSVHREPGPGHAQQAAYESSVDYGFFETMQVSLVAGRGFDRDQGDDSSAVAQKDYNPDIPVNVVIDRAFSDQLGFAGPAAAVNQVVYMSQRLYASDASDQPLRIIGVVENKPLHFIGLGASANVFRLGKGLSDVVVRISAKSVPATLSGIQGVWKDLAPDRVFDYAFEDQLFAEGYAIFGTVGTAFTALALFAFLISSIGLVGMAVDVASRRRREIGVRKTLGANTRQIVMMLLKDFSKPVLIANVIAWPLAYLATKAYLGTFIHRIALTPLPFVLSLVVTLLIAWSAVGLQSWRAARAKPGTVLRYE